MDIYDIQFKIAFCVTFKQIEQQHPYELCVVMYHRDVEEDPEGHFETYIYFKCEWMCINHCVVSLSLTNIYFS